jgi:hypothetical protein
VFRSSEGYGLAEEGFDVVPVLLIPLIVKPFSHDGHILGPFGACGMEEFGGKIGNGL